MNHIELRPLRYFAAELAGTRHLTGTNAEGAYVPTHVVVSPRCVSFGSLQSCQAHVEKYSDGFYGCWPDEFTILPVQEVREDGRPLPADAHVTRLVLTATAPRLLPFSFTWDGRSDLAPTHAAVEYRGGHPVTLATGGLAQLDRWIIERTSVPSGLLNPPAPTGEHVIVRLRAQ